MDINLVCTLFVLENKRNSNIRKNDILNLKILVKKEDKSLYRIKFEDKGDIKEVLRKGLAKTIGTDNFHLEQVYTLGEKKYYKDNFIDIIYLGIANIEKISKLDKQYELVDFGIWDNRKVLFDDTEYLYKTIEKKSESGIEYLHEIETKDLNLEKKLLELIISYKHIRSRLDNTDILFKFMPKQFALEDVRVLYELIKGISVDKSNFRKKIMKYCIKADKVVDDKGYRPTNLFEYKSLENDKWI